MIKGLINSKLDIFLISDTKIDQIFPNQQFSIEGHEIYHYITDIEIVLVEVYYFTRMKIYLPLN